nr:RNA-directed DNA polymerase, eukaryota, reverse transcriptase zinc-binding domain protein [Tanacetum cinerariifolium]GEZ74750.1 RNA-directed DNA polymerase, eukaryota, reverse transcriptase zinc-binding domain protein [Tanacetum cinerariifolium]
SRELGGYWEVVGKVLESRGSGGVKGRVGERVLRVSKEGAQSMIVDVSDNEIKRAMFDIDYSKAPGKNARQIEKDSKFQYHFGCKSLKLVHVCFADDLLVMCHGDTSYVEVIKKALDEFNTCSGLLPNSAKSTTFFGGLCDKEREAITNILPFTTGKLPVRYFGVSLIAKRLSVKDCGNLIDRIRSKITNWKNKGKSIWEISMGSADIWGWKNLLTIRDLIRDNVKSIIVLVEEIADRNIWRDRNGQDMKFSVHTAYNDMTDQHPVILITSSSSVLSQKIYELRSIVRRIAFAACIYSIWQERNGRIFRDERKNYDEVFKSIVNKVRHRLLGLTVKDSLAVRDTESKWGISCRRIK